MSLLAWCERIADLDRKIGGANNKIEYWEGERRSCVAEVEREVGKPYDEFIAEMRKLLEPKEGWISAPSGCHCPLLLGACERSHLPDCPLASEGERIDPPEPEGNKPCGVVERRIHPGCHCTYKHRPDCPFRTEEGV